MKNNKLSETQKAPEQLKQFESMLAAKTIRPFSNGSQFADWAASNCERCNKYCIHASKGACEIDFAVGMAYLADGSVTVDIAKRMGYLDNTGEYNWQCNEVDWREEWKAKVLARRTMG